LLDGIERRARRVMSASRCNPHFTPEETASVLRPTRAPAEEVDAVYPKPTRELMYRQSMSFIDPNEVGFQVFPDFDLEVPALE
jgi:hypothetical protein